MLSLLSLHKSSVSFPTRVAIVPPKKGLDARGRFHLKF